MKETDEVLVGPARVTVFERGPYAKQVGFTAPDGAVFYTVTVPEPSELSEPGPGRQDSLAEDYARSQRRSRWVLRLLITGVLIGAVIYARWLWGRL